MIPLHSTQTRESGRIIGGSLAAEVTGTAVLSSNTDRAQRQGSRASVLTMMQASPSARSDTWWRRLTVSADTQGIGVRTADRRSHRAR